jgi:predicted transcriptional regulator
MTEKTAGEILFVKVDDALKAGIVEVAASQDRTISSFVRSTLRKVVAEHRRQAQAEPAIA